MDFKPERLFGDAIDAARGAVRDLDADQVPASLRRVAGYAGGSLPPPFARSLLAELDTNEFLRSKALEAWKGERPPTGDEALASYRFLERGDGWIMEVAEAAFRLGKRLSVASDHTLEVERNAFEAEAASLRGRLKAARKDRDRIESELRELSRTQQDPVREERNSQRRIAQQIEGAKRDHTAEMEKLEALLSETENEIRSVREAARLDRRLRAEAEAAYQAAVASESPPMDAEGLAEHLDVIAALATATGPGSRLAGGGMAGLEDDRLRYPGMIRPDSAEGIEWLLGAGPVTVLVDGYNLGFLLAGRLDPQRARMLVVEALGRLATAAGEAEVVAVFDSDGEVDTDVPQRGGSVDVVYSSGRSADDEIVDRVVTALNPVVVTNDREVRHRAEAVGAVALWSDALVEWSRRR